MDGDAFLSSDEVCSMADVTYRQLDYWTRTHAIEPAIGACGSGSKRRWTPRQACAVRIMGGLSSTGAEHLQLREVWAYLMDRPLESWHGAVYVDRLGRVSEDLVGGWVIDLADARGCLSDDMVAA